MPAGQVTQASRAAQLAGLRGIWAQKRVAALDRVALGVKVCTGCGQLCKLEEFPPDSSRVDGRRSRCHACCAKAAKTSMAELRAARRAPRLEGWTLRCCGDGRYPGYLVNDPVLGFWVAVHSKRCKALRPWQPDRVGVDGSWELLHGRSVKQRNRKAR